MASQTVTATAGPLPPPKVRAALEQGRAVFLGFTEAFPQTIKYRATHRKQPPPSLAGAASVEMRELAIDSTLDARKVTPALVGQMLQLVQEIMPPQGMFECSGTLTALAEGSRTNYDDHGAADVAWKQSAYWLGFRPGCRINLTQAMKDGTLEKAQQEVRAYQLQQLTAAIARATVPLEEVPEGQGRTFRHTGGGQWEYSHSHPAVGPLNFRCQMPGIAPEDLAARMESLLVMCDSPLPRSYSFRIHVPSGEAAPAYEFVRHTDWPLRETEIRASLQLTGSQSLETLTRLSSGSGIAVKLAEFKLPSPDSKAAKASLSAKVKQNGCELQLKLPGTAAAELPELSRELGVTFQTSK